MATVEMAMTPAETSTVARAIALRDEEIEARDQARHLELDPAHREAARELFLRANGLRKARLALLERCGLR